MALLAAAMHINETNRAPIAPVCRSYSGGGGASLARIRTLYDRVRARRRQVEVMRKCARANVYERYEQYDYSARPNFQPFEHAKQGHKALQLN